jgi:extracellular elastinolytic metalloproteinase
MNVHFISAGVTAFLLLASGSFAVVAAPQDVHHDAAIEAARAYLREHRPSPGLTEADVASAAVSSVVPDAQTGVTHVYFVQRHGGIDVRGAELNVTVSPSGEAVSAVGRFLSNLSINRDTPVLDAVEAARAAARSLKLTPSSPLEVVRVAPGPARETTLTPAGLAAEKIPVKLVYQRTATDGVRLAWLVDVERPDGSHSWVVVIDAESGAILETTDRVVSG